MLGVTEPERIMFVFSAKSEDVLWAQPTHCLVRARRPQHPLSRVILKTCMKSEQVLPPQKLSKETPGVTEPGVSEGCWLASGSLSQWICRMGVSVSVKGGLSLVCQHTGPSASQKYQPPEGPKTQWVELLFSVNKADRPP